MRIGSRSDVEDRRTTEARLPADVPPTAVPVQPPEARDPSLDEYEWVRGRQCLEALPTETRHRASAQADYVVCVNASQKKSLGLGRLAVVARPVETPVQRCLKVVCRVLVDDGLDDDQVRFDKTLRYALAIPRAESRVEVRVFPLNAGRTVRADRIVSKVFGRSHLFLRVHKADPGDIEKDFVRISDDSFSLLGATPGTKVIMHAPIRRGNGYELRALAVRAQKLTTEVLERRSDARTTEPDPNRYPDAKRVFGVEPDIADVFMDVHARDELGVDLLDALQVRRDHWDVFARESRAFGVTFFLSTFAIAQVLPLKETWGTFALTVGVAALLATVLTLVNMRAMSSA